MKSHIYHTVSCTMKRLQIWIWYMNDFKRVRECDESNEEVWWDILISYKYEHEEVYTVMRL